MGINATASKSYLIFFIASLSNNCFNLNSFYSVRAYYLGRNFLNTTSIFEVSSNF